MFVFHIHNIHLERKNSFMFNQIPVKLIETEPQHIIYYTQKALTSHFSLMLVCMPYESDTKRLLLRLLT